MKCLRAIKTEQFKQRPETFKMASNVEKTNINNVKDNQNGRKKMTVIGQYKK